MKNFILTLGLLIITSITFSQTTLKIGYLDTDNEFVIESQTELQEGFKFKKSRDNEEITCTVYNTDGSKIEILSWDILEMTIENGMHTYEVIDADDHICLITFMTERKGVIIIDTYDDNKFSSMQGDDLKYSGL